MTYDLLRLNDRQMLDIMALARREGAFMMATTAPSPAGASIPSVSSSSSSMTGGAGYSTPSRSTGSAPSSSRRPQHLSRGRRRARCAHRRAAPPPQRDERPDGLDHAERPCPLQKSVRRSQHARARERQHEPAAARLERIAHQHRHDREQTEQRQRIEPRHAATVADFDCRPRADVGRGLPTWGPWNHEAAGRFEPAAAGLHRMRGAR